jgi:hypothetical protein
MQEVAWCVDAMGVDTTSGNFRMIFFNFSQWNSGTKTDGKENYEKEGGPYLLPKYLARSNK